LDILATGAIFRRFSKKLLKIFAGGFPDDYPSSCGPPLGHGLLLSPGGLRKAH
jgi:hypothetical protein